MENKTAEEVLKSKLDELSMNNGSFPNYKHWDKECRSYILEAMEEYASIKLAEKDKKIERLSKWNLSEEKPKSEVPVLAIIKGNKIPVRVMWVEKFSLSSDEWEFNGEEDYNEENDTYYWPEGWYEWNEMEEVHWMCKDVLFWMDMPQIPESLNM